MYAAARFVEWWRARANDSLGSAERFADEVEAELRRLGGWDDKNMHAAMEDVAHLREALYDLRRDLGFAPDGEAS